MPAEREASALVKVWDRPVRGLHWALATTCMCAWLSAEFLAGWHERAGYAALVVVAARMAWGFAASGHARLAHFVRGPRITWRYAAAVVARTAPRYLGHNPLGGWMALALWTCVACLGLTGWLFSTDMFWGEGWLDLTHQVLAWLLIVLVALHVAGVIVTGRKHEENLVAAMLSGSKRPPGPRDIA